MALLEFKATYQYKSLYQQWFGVPIPSNVTQGVQWSIVVPATLLLALYMFIALLRDAPDRVRKIRCLQGLYEGRIDRASIGAGRRMSLYGDATVKASDTTVASPSEPAAFASITTTSSTAHAACHTPVPEAMVEQVQPAMNLAYRT